MAAGSVAVVTLEGPFVATMTTSVTVLWLTV